MRLLTGASASRLPSPLLSFARARPRCVPASTSASACRAASSSATAAGDGGAQKPWLFVGLGNPGKVYQGTRHNVGFEMIDVIAEAEGISVSSMQFKAMVGKGRAEIGSVPCWRGTALWPGLPHIRFHFQASLPSATAMQHHLRRCSGGAFAALRRLRRFPAAAAVASPMAARRCPFPPRLYSTAEMSQQLPANLVETMEQRMKLIEQRSAYLQEQINQPAASPEEYSRANKEFRKLESTMELIKELRSKQEEIEGLKSLVTNSIEEKDMREMAAEELLEAVEEEKRLQHALLRSLLPKDEADERDCILEVRAGTGGEEASLFAMDIFRMYEKYSQKNGWKFDVIDIMESALKGYKEASGTISGPGAYGKLKFESGIHRVQRVPVTEKSGRVHTSAVSVAVLPQADEVDVQLRNEDLRIDTYRSGGSGGQSVNTTDSAVRITHVPTGTVVAIQDERSQHQNKAKALKVLRARLYEMERHRLHLDRSKLRSEQIGSGDRSERIRTYNFPQGRVTDHRVGITHHSIEDVMEGESLDIFIDALLLQEEMDVIASFAS